MKQVFVMLAVLISQSVAAANLGQVRAFLDATYAADRPGAAVVIMEEGEIVLQDGYGLANVEHGIPITNDTIFRVGSVTKQFTSAAIMLLRQRGELSVDDSISEYLPNYPAHGHHITIQHLLNHTSGIKSYTGIPGYMDQEIRKDLTTEELIGVFENQPMEFAPGDAWNYNNSGYVLLGAIIEAVSGQSYEDFIADNIAAPLGLDSTLYGGPKLIPNRASGYEMDEDGRIINAGYVSMTQPHAAGSLLSTTGDLVNWHQALTGGEFIHDDSYRQMTSVAELNDGETFPYGYGLGVGQMRDRRMISHGGGIHGFTCYSLWLPEQDIYVAVLTNGATEGPGPSTVAKMITAMYVDDPYPARKATALNHEDQSALEGTYESSEFPPIEISASDGTLTMTFPDDAPEVIYAESRELLFMDNSLDYVIVEWQDGAATRLLYHYEEGVPPVEMIRAVEDT